MIELNSKEQMDNIIGEGGFSLFYLSRPECGVCGVLKKKVEDMCLSIHGIKTYYVNLNNDETISGQYSIFTIPGILVYVNGKETIREARYISVGDIENRLLRICNLLI